MEKDTAQYSLLGRSSSEASDTCVDSDCEPLDFLFEKQRTPLRVRLISGWKWACLQSKSLARLLFRATLILLPSYVQRWICGGAPQSKKIHPTSALDGLRGIACFIVFNFHLLFTYSDVCQFGYGANDENLWYHQLPFLRLIYAGPAMVAVFFVISGYVLSVKPLRLIQKQAWDQASRAVSSSVFRRALRLFLPTLMATFMTMLLLRAGMFKYATEITLDKETLLGHNEEHPIYLETFQEQLEDWELSVWTLTDPWTWDMFYCSYDPHLWTIPVEFRSSIVLFVTLVALSRLMTVPRMILSSSLIWYCVLSNRWEVVLFLCGMLLSDIDLATGMFDCIDENHAISSTKRWARRVKRPVCILIFILGLYFASYPNIDGEKTPGYQSLVAYTPETYSQKFRWWQSVGSVLIVWSVNHSKDIQVLFTNAFSNYLGNISYAFYIVHGPILHSLGYVAMKTSWSYTGKETTTRYSLGFLMGLTIVLPVVFWAADIFWRLVDIPCVNFSRWIESKLVIKTA